MNTQAQGASTLVPASADGLSVTGEVRTVKTPPGLSDPCVHTGARGTTR